MSSAGQFLSFSLGSLKKFCASCLIAPLAAAAGDIRPWVAHTPGKTRSAATGIAPREIFPRDGLLELTDTLARMVDMLAHTAEIVAAMVDNTAAAMAGNRAVDTAAADNSSVSSWLLA